MSSLVLVIDDDNVTLAILEKALKESGFDVLTALDGMKGFDLIQMKKPDVVICDMLLPKLHGLDLCQRIRDDYLLSKGKVILMSAVYDDQLYSKEIKTSGADYFLKKPLDIPKLIGLVKELVKTLD